MKRPATAEKLLQKVSFVDSVRIEKTLENMPYCFQGHIAGIGLGKFDKEGAKACNAYFYDLDDKLKVGLDCLLSDDDLLVKLAKKSAEDCALYIAPFDDDDFDDDGFCLLMCAEYLKRHGIVISSKALERKPAFAWIARFKCEMWWCRQLRRLHRRASESLGIASGLVNAKKGCYASNECVARRKEQIERNDQILADLLAVNDAGDEYTLSELSALSVSNPAIRRAELMVRMSGFEKLAIEAGHVGEFLTFTTPSRFHSHHGKTGFKNKKWDGSNPRAGQAYLCAMWAKIRAALDRSGIRAYGFRVAEPHHDGTPHWHMMLFIESGNRVELRKICKAYALEDTPEEVLDASVRFKAVAINWAKGSATGYIAKYISKNIDGTGHDEALDGDKKEVPASRVAAWAACWGIRQFQQIGGSSVTVWRELRRLHDEECGTIETARLAADASDWAEYNRVQGGVMVGRSKHVVKLAKWVEFDLHTGEFIDSPMNRYGESSAGRVFGVMCAGVAVVTRLWRWKIGRVGDNFDGFKVDEDLRGAFALGIAQRKQAALLLPTVVREPSPVKSLSSWFIENPAIEEKMDYIRTANTPNDSVIEWHEFSNKIFDALHMVDGVIEYGLRGFCPSWSPVNNCTQDRKQHKTLTNQ